MKKIILLTLFLTNLIHVFGQNDSIVFPLYLSESDAFVIAEYNTIYYDTINFFEEDNEKVNKIPNNLSFQSFNVALSPKHSTYGIVDLNYLYLHCYSVPNVTSGRLFYFISEKTPPENRHNIIEKKEVGRYFELSSICNVEYGYWIKIPEKDLIVLIFRKKVKVKSMKDFRIFSGIIGKEGLYITNAMNPKDDYLFDNKFKRILDKNIDIQLPIELSHVFHHEKITIVPLKGDTIHNKNISVKYWNKTVFDENFNKCNPVISSDSLKSEGFSRMKYNQGITSDFTELSLNPTKKNKFSFKTKYILIQSTNSDGYIDYNKIKTKNRSGYFDVNDFDESIFMNIQLQDTTTVNIEIQYPK